MENTITEEKLTKSFEVTEKALEMAKSAPLKLKDLESQRADCLDMIERYVQDAHHFKEQGDIVNAFGALYYAHGWLDAGARIGMFDVKDSTLFTVDDE